MITIRKTMLAGLVAGLLLATAACQKEGPAEKAGKEVDKAATNVGQQVEKAGDAIKDAAQGDKK